MIEPTVRKKTSSFPIILVNSAPQMMQSFEDEQGFIHLACLCSQFQMHKWCKHIEAVYTSDEELDSDQITSTCGVQLYKSPHSLFLDTLVLPMGDDLDDSLCEVQVIWGNISTSKQNGGLIVDGQYSIGFIRRGVQGRRTIRRLIFEWLVAIPAVFPDKMVCLSTSHKYGDCYFDTFVENEMTQLERTSWRNRDAVMLLDEKMCYSCAQVVMRPFDPPKNVTINLHTTSSSASNSNFFAETNASAHFYVDVDGNVQPTPVPKGWK